ncbi:MAG: hypothetical protein G5663_02795 [Serratia symbiotica]|nr:hypothetical protein [Serratia symbiotica]
MAVDTETYEVICSDLSLSNVTDTKAFPGLICQTYREVEPVIGRQTMQTKIKR